MRLIEYISLRHLSFRCEFYGCLIPKDGVLPTLVPPRTTPGTTGVVTPHTTGMPNISTSICQALTII